VRLDLGLPPACTVRGDAQRLQQLIMNLVLNSVQAMPEGGVLRVRLQEEDGAACLRFEDTGPGIPAGLRERVFEPFFTTREKGSGLGLTVVRRIVEQHGGSIALGAAETGGTRVDIRLPLA
jgi:signal transduction histidine kinase